MRLTDDGGLLLGADAACVVRLAWRCGRAWRAMALRWADGGTSGTAGELAAADGPVRARLRLWPDMAGVWGFEVSMESAEPTRLQMRVEMADADAGDDPFHLIPGVIHGDNNLSRAEPGHFPNLTRLHGDSVSCATYWELRADRASHPLSLMGGQGVIVGAAIDPYSDRTPGALLAPTGRDGFIRNGVFAQLGGGGTAADGAATPHACGVTLGYGNLPRTFLNKDQWLDSTAHFVTHATARGFVFAVTATGRTAAHGLIRRAYEATRDTPAAPISAREAMHALTDALVHINYHGSDGRPARQCDADGVSDGRVSSTPITASAFLGGGPVADNFTNMRCIDERKQRLAPWRTLAEVGWTGGGVIAYPLLIAGQALGGEPGAAAVTLALQQFDRVADAINPASGLLWDVHGRHEGKRLNWWWSGYLVKDCHCAYTNGSAAYYLLKAHAWMREAMGLNRDRWLDTSRRVLDTLVALQRPDGNYGFTYSAQRPEMLDEHGFAGAWFMPAMVLAYRATGHEPYLASARRAAEFYHRFVADLSCWGTPMDTWKSPDQEGNLAFLRGAALLHQATGEPRHLRMLEDSTHYEYLWRYGFRARPEYPPLKDSPFNSCGGSITSVSNPHIHPMGAYVARELGYLAEQLAAAGRADDARYHRRRREDGLNWSRNIVSLYPHVTGYGAPGVLTERFCPSDGLTVETFPDGSPSSLWFSYNGWAAAAVLEGLAEAIAEGAG